LYVKVDPQILSNRWYCAGCRTASAASYSSQSSSETKKTCESVNERTKKQTEEEITEGIQKVGGEEGREKKKGCATNKWKR